MVSGNFISTSTSSTATSYPFQRKTFYANGRFWVFYCSGSVFGYQTSTDGVTWSSFTQINSVSSGRQFSVYFDGTYVHYVWASESGGAVIYYRRGTPNSDGSITWSTSDEQNAVPAYNDEDGRYSNTIWSLYPSLQVSPSIYRLDPLASGVTADWTTEVNIGSYGAGNKFVFTPYSTVTTPYGTSLPTAIQNKGWMYAVGYMTQKKVWMLDGLFVLQAHLRNPTSLAHAGNLYARLWVSPNSNMSSATALTGWSYASVSFDGTLNQGVTVSINLNVNSAVGNAFAVNGQYLYLEVLWDVTTAATGARVQLEAEMDTEFHIPGYVAIPYYPNIAVDSNRYPWISFGRYNGIGYYPYVVKGDSNTGSFTFRLSTPTKLSATSDVRRYPSAIAILTSGKIYVAYSKAAIYGKLWDGSGWGSEETVATASAAQYFSLTNEGDNIHFVYLAGTTYNIEYKKRTYGTGWDASATVVQASATSTSSPIISIDTNNKLYVFWSGSPTANHIYYKKCVSGTWDSSPTDWQDESTETLTGNDLLTCFYMQYGNYIGLVYMTKTASPYNVKYGFLELVPPPAVAKKTMGDGLTWIMS